MILLNPVSLPVRIPVLLGARQSARSDGSAFARCNEARSPPFSKRQQPKKCKDIHYIKRSEKGKVFEGNSNLPF
jgi:hypothetical protein